jgi:hypothetical protein
MLVRPDLRRQAPPPQRTTEAAKTLLAWIIGLNAIRSGTTVAALDFEMGPETTRLLLQDLGATLDEIRSIYYVEPDEPPLPSDYDALIDSGAKLAIIDAGAGAYGVSDLDDGKRKFAPSFVARTRIQTLAIDLRLSGFGSFHVRDLLTGSIRVRGPAVSAAGSGRSSRTPEQRSRSSRRPHPVAAVGAALEELQVVLDADVTAGVAGQEHHVELAEDRVDGAALPAELA